ncbi:protein panoramix [Drosophila busckii]|uniref:protein panoramix n=1 Tax=Drosophila busckii TaxID=30019 RepID=UPI00083EB911|nr:protein panoramix [Drosophila busckii]
MDENVEITIEEVIKIERNQDDEETPIRDETNEPFEPTVNALLTGSWLTDDEADAPTQPPVDGQQPQIDGDLMSFPDDYFDCLLEEPLAAKIKSEDELEAANELQHEDMMTDVTSTAQAASQLTVHPEPHNVQEEELPAEVKIEQNFEQTLENDMLAVSSSQTVGQMANLDSVPDNNNNCDDLQVTVKIEKSIVQQPDEELAASSSQTLNQVDNVENVDPVPDNNCNNLLVKSEEQLLRLAADISLEVSQVDDIDNLDLEPPIAEPPEKKRKRNGSRRRQRKHDEQKRMDLILAQMAAYPARPLMPIKVELPEQLDYVPVRPCERSIKVTNLSQLLPEPKQPQPQTRSIKEVRQLARERVNAALNLIQLWKSKAPETEFLMVDTIRQLPKPSSYMSSAVFQHPSPLCNNYNVRYRFNSTTDAKIDLSQWGLEALPQTSTNLLRLTGISVSTLRSLVADSKMPMAKLRKQEQAEHAAKRNESDSYSMGLYKTMSTQTDPRIGNRGQDAGVQVNRLTHSVYWEQPSFNETHLMQSEFNVMSALKELTAAAPNSPDVAHQIYSVLREALIIKRRNY